MKCGLPSQGNVTVYTGLLRGLNKTVYCKFLTQGWAHRGAQKVTQSILIPHGFHSLLITFLLNSICNPKVNAHRHFPRQVQTCTEWGGTWVALCMCSQLRLNTAAPCLLVHTIHKCLFYMLFNVTFFTLFAYCWWCFKQQPKCNAEVLYSVLECRKAVMCLLEKMCVLEKLHSGTGDSAVDMSSMLM